jgi:hypothetical protein
MGCNAQKLPVQSGNLKLTSNSVYIIQSAIAIFNC